MIYAYVKLTITNPESWSRYREHAIGALSKHGGKVVHATKDILVLDGNPDVPDVGVILSFPDRASAQSWINDPELAEIHDLRRGAGGSDILLLD